MAVLFRRPVLLLFSAAFIIYSFVYAQYVFGLPIYISEIFKDRAKYYGIIMSVNAIVVVVAKLFLIEFMKKNKPLVNITIVGLLFAVGFGMIFFIKLFAFFIVSTIIWTFGEIISTVNSNVLIANYSPISHCGRFNAVITFIGQAGFANSRRVFGRLIGAIGSRNIWPIMFLLSIVASIFMFGLYFYEKKKSPAA
ncbi:MAG: MFS transporter [Candidatus Humimicrobiaceae bacterium]